MEFKVKFEIHEIFRETGFIVIKPTGLVFDTMPEAIHEIGKIKVFAGETKYTVLTTFTIPGLHN